MVNIPTRGETPLLSLDHDQMQLFASTTQEEVDSMAAKLVQTLGTVADDTLYAQNAFESAKYDFTRRVEKRTITENAADSLALIMNAPDTKELIYGFYIGASTQFLTKTLSLYDMLLRNGKYAHEMTDDRAIVIIDLCDHLAQELRCRNDHAASIADNIWPS